MTLLMYQTDSYKTEFDAVITNVDPEARTITLDRSLFYPGGGGQPYDLGKIILDKSEFPVTRVKKAGDDVLHFIGGAGLLPAIGENIHGIIDWDRRYKLM
ncbi:MAG: alanine--tRNA ligase-related protein [Chloroflexota bacterium]